MFLVFVELVQWTILNAHLKNYQWNSIQKCALTIKKLAWNSLKSVKLIMHSALLKKEKYMTLYASMNAILIMQKRLLWISLAKNAVNSEKTNKFSCQYCNKDGWKIWISLWCVKSLTSKWLRMDNPLSHQFLIAIKMEFKQESASITKRKSTMANANKQ
jgi:hypothetical protein